MTSDWIVDAPVSSLRTLYPEARLAIPADGSRLSLRGVVRAFQQARDHAQDGSRIWQLGADYDLSLLGEAGRAIVAAPTLGAALLTLQQAFPLIQSGAHVSFDVRPDGAEFSYRVLHPDIWPRQADAELTLGLVFGIVRRFVPDAPVAVTFEHVADAASAALQRTLKWEASMGAEGNSIIVPVAALDRTPAVSPPPEYGDARTRVAAMLGDLERETPLHHRVRSEILARLGRDEVDQSAVAGQLGVSDRTLRLQLGAVGLSYRKVLEDCRIEVAEALLQQTSLPMSEIAWRLGYSEPSAFSRAARRWFGCPPDRKRAAA